MATQCYAMVRGSAIRVTGLNRRGGVSDPILLAVSKAVAKVTINEITESSSSELIGSDEQDNDTRLHFVRPEQTVSFGVDIDFLRCDPGILSLVAGVPLVYKDTVGGTVLGFGEGGFGEMGFGGSGGVGLGFGEGGFGEMSFGGGEDVGSTSQIVGFDFPSRLVPASFAMEVWSKLAGAACVDGRQWGYTLFPFLKGGYLSGFKFDKGLVSFNLRNAKARRGPRWGVGPFDLEGPHQRLLTPVSRNTLFRQITTPMAPPVQTDGVTETEDIISGGTASVTSSDIISGGTASATTPWIISGGRAS